MGRAGDAEAVERLAEQQVRLPAEKVAQAVAAHEPDLRAGQRPGAQGQRRAGQPGLLQTSESVQELDVSVWEVQSRWPWLLHCQPPLSTLVPWQPLLFQEPFSEPRAVAIRGPRARRAHVLTEAHSVVLLTAAWWIAGAELACLRSGASALPTIRSPAEFRSRFFPRCNGMVLLPQQDSRERAACDFMAPFSESRNPRPGRSCLQRQENIGNGYRSHVK